MGIRSNGYEDKEIYTGYRCLAMAWRHLPHRPDWRVNVTFGDGGYEVEPGVDSAPPRVALTEVDDALEELKALRAALVEAIKNEAI